MFIPYVADIMASLASKLSSFIFESILAVNSTKNTNVHTESHFPLSPP